ncbi:hypothetical protein ISS04_03255 [Candidatus Woesearchaeota archaeon]|nr:hypothetical protein [Candidatus Woesearchaeota archaeon]
MTKKRPISIYLDKVERKFLDKLKDERTEYSHLDIDQIAHLELKTQLLNNFRKKKTIPGL